MLYYISVFEVCTAEEQLVVGKATWGRRTKTAKKNTDCMKKEEEHAF